MILEGLNLFAATTGLKASPTKSNIYGCGMTDQELQRIVDRSGFKVGSLPFRYLGVPISAKKLSISDYEKLIEKMTCRIRTWSTRNISFAGS